jgi:hypothetical protein
MDSLPHTLWPSLAGLLLIALVVRRSLRVRKLRPDRMLLLPGIVALVALFMLAQDPPREPLTIAVLAGAVLAGGAIGWRRGALTRISHDPADGSFTAEPSKAAVVLILVVFALRYGVKLWLSASPDGRHSHAAELAANALLISSVGLIAAQRVEMVIRCRKLMADASATA